jgi:uncharacterized protein (TIGR00369 family)
MAAEQSPPSLASLDPAEAVRLVNETMRSGLPEKLGMECLELSTERAVFRMPVAGNVQPYGLLHGGATASLCESVASIGTAFVVPEKRVTGVELNINHLRAVREGFVTATGVPVHVGRSLAVWDMKVHDDDGRLVAVSRLTLAIRDFPPPA